MCFYSKKEHFKYKCSFKNQVLQKVAFCISETDAFQKHNGVFQDKYKAGNKEVKCPFLPMSIHAYVAVAAASFFTKLCLKEKKNLKFEVYSSQFSFCCQKPKLNFPSREPMIFGYLFPPSYLFNLLWWVCHFILETSL